MMLEWMYVCMGGFNFQLSSFSMYDAWFSMIMVIGDSCLYLRIRVPRGLWALSLFLNNMDQIWKLERIRFFDVYCMHSLLINICW